MRVHQLLHLNALDEQGLLHFPLRLVGGVLLVAGCIADLALAGRVRIEGDALQVLDPTPLQDPALDAVLAALPGTQVETAARELMAEIAIVDLCAQGLVRDGLATLQTQRLLLVFKKHVLQPADSPQVRAAKGLLGRAMAGQALSPQEHTALALCVPAELLPFMAAGEDIDPQTATASIQARCTPEQAALQRVLAAGVARTRRGAPVQH